jgi:hypothetical protein
LIKVKHKIHKNVSFEGFKVELVSKELNNFEGIASFFRDWAPGTLTGGELTFVYVPPFR